MTDQINNIPVYNAFGLNIQCELPTASLFGMTGESQAEPDAVIRFAKIPSVLEGIIYQDGFISYAPGHCLLKIKGVARYLVTAGKEILIEPEPGATEGDIATFTFGSAIGILLYQRGILALHGSAIRTSKGAVIFSGEKGSGKSTTAAALAARGWEFMSDDLSAVHLEKGKALLYPGLSRAKLTADSYSSVLGNTPDSAPISPILEKYGVSYQTKRNPSPLFAVCLLEISPNNPYIEPISGAKRFPELAKTIYRPLIHQLVINLEQQFSQCAAISAQALVFRIFRSSEYSKMEEYLQLIEKTILTQRAI